MKGGIETQWTIIRRRLAKVLIIWKWNKYHDLILRALTHKQGFLKRYYSLHDPVGVMENQPALPTWKSQGELWRRELRGEDTWCPKLQRRGTLEQHGQQVSLIRHRPLHHSKHLPYETGCQEHFGQPYKATNTGSYTSASWYPEPEPKNN